MVPVPPVDRRTVLGGVAGGAATLAGCSLLESSEDADAAETDPDRARSLAERFAPTLYFDSAERWFPTDPRAYESERDGATVVDGFDALDGYVERWTGETPPDPTVFYHAIEYEKSPLAVVQFWFYSAFDQFATNFHWHDWELLQVFVDTGTGEPQLYVASSHSRRVPNNEFLDPDPDRRPRILSELGSHSSGLSVNEAEERFQRFPLDEDVADITNSVLDGVEDIASIPLAYGLPRDEGLVLPYLVPELDGAPVYEDDRLPSVAASDLVADELTVSSLDALSSPPADLPARETGRRFEYAGRDTDAGVAYELAPTAELEHIDEFAGPQLSFEFAVPGFAEDAVASHLTTTGVPWESPRYDNPAADISEPRHRQALADRYEAIGAPSPVNRVVVGVTNAVASEDAPDGKGLTTVPSPTEMVALFQSEHEAVPTFRGVAALQGVPAGEHRLTINGAGVAPHSETVSVSGADGPPVAGVGGEIPVVARENAMKLEVDPRGTDSDLTGLAVADDFAGRLYDAPLSGPDAVYVHRGGAFTTEVRDSENEVGAFRVDPGDEDQMRIDEPTTGKASLATYIADVAAETRAEVAAADGDEDEDGDGDDTGDSDDDDDDDDDAPGTGTGTGAGAGGEGSENAVRGLSRALDAVAAAARRSAERAAAGDRGNANRNLEAVATRLERVATRLSAASDSLPPGLARAADNRLEQVQRRAEQAREARKL